MIKKLTQYPIPNNIKFVLESFFLLFIVFFINRCLFYFFCNKQAEFSSTLIKAFGVGMFFDIVTISRLIIVPFFVIIILQFFNTKKHIIISIFYLFLLVFGFLCSLILAANIPYYNQFNFHITSQIFVWTSNLNFVTKLIFGSFSYYGFIIIFVIVFFGLKYLITHRKKKYLLPEENKGSFKKNVLVNIFLFLLLTVASIGRLSTKEPLHSGYAIISEDNFINNLGLNPVFTFIESMKESNSIYVEPSNIKVKLKRVQKILNADQQLNELSKIENKDSTFKDFNIVIVCMESMSSYKMGIHGHPTLTPVFNSILNESIYFDRFFSSGIHTYNGIFSILTGYPAIYSEHSLRQYTKRPFITLANLLQLKGYETSFYATHDPQFDNMEGFVKLNGFKNVFSNSDLPYSESISVTGVPDHVLFDLFIKQTNQLNNKPFFSFIMTGSDHGPWAIPKNIPFKPNANEKEMRSTQYADWALGQLIEKSKLQPWYKNTIFVFVADHGYALSNCYEMPLSFHHIPFAIYQPNLFRPMKIKNIGYQPDVLPTLAGLLKLEFQNSTFGLNLLSNKHDFIYFTADDKLGCMSNDGYYFYEIRSQRKKYLKFFDSLSPKDYYNLRRTIADSLENEAKDMIDVAQYFIRKNFFRN